MLKKASDDIQDDLVQWIQEPGLPGANRSIEDPLFARDAWINSLWLGFEHRGEWGLNLANKFKYEVIRQGDKGEAAGMDDTRFLGLVNKADVARNLGPFVEQMMTRPQSSPVNWGGHVRSFFETANPNVALLRFEDLLGDGAAALAGAMGRLTGETPDADRARAAVEKYAFETMSGRERGDEDRSSYLRKGQAGDWVNHFTPEAAAAFDRYCGDVLIAAGYEKDRSWVERVSS